MTTTFRPTAEITVPLPQSAAIAMFTAEGERTWAGGHGWDPRYPEPSRASGVGAVFLTAHGGRETVWVIVAEATDRMSYVRVTPGGLAGTVEVAAVAATEATTLRDVTYDMTALRAEAVAELEAFEAGYDDEIASWEAHVYLDTVLLIGSLANAHGATGRWWFGAGARLLAPVLTSRRAWRVVDVVTPDGAGRRSPVGGCVNTRCASSLPARVLAFATRAGAVDNSREPCVERRPNQLGEHDIALGSGMRAVTCCDRRPPHWIVDKSFDGRHERLARLAARSRHSSGELLDPVVLWFVVDRRRPDDEHRPPAACAVLERRAERCQRLRDRRARAFAVHGRVVHPNREHNAPDLAVAQPRWDFDHQPRRHLRRRLATHPEVVCGRDPRPGRRPG